MPCPARLSGKPVHSRSRLESKVSVRERTHPKLTVAILLQLSKFLKAEVEVI